MDYVKFLEKIKGEYKNRVGHSWFDAIFLAVLKKEKMQEDEFQTWFASSFSIEDDNTGGQLFEIYVDLYPYITVRLRVHQHLLQLNDMSKSAIQGPNENLITEIDALKQQVEELQKNVEPVKRRKIEE